MFTTSGTLPRNPGTYVLWFELSEPADFPELRLRLARLLPGQYVYVGSALGPGGLQARLRRHLDPDWSQAQRRHWHIDYLTAIRRPTSVGFCVSPLRLECVWTQQVHAAGADWAIRGFGSSDCRQGCQSHLLRVPHGWTIETLKDLFV